MSALPEGWDETALEGLIAVDGLFTDGDWVESKDQDPSGAVRLIQLADIGETHFLNKSNRFLTSDKAAELNCTFLQKGDILIARMPDPLGRCCMFPFDEHERYVTVVDVCALRVGRAEISHGYLMWTINSPRVRAQIAALQSGSTRKRVSRKNLATVAIPVAPFNEQRRIVERIEALFAEIDKGVESLHAARTALGLYRQSLLKSAFEGRLTADWRAANPDKLETPDALLARIKSEREARHKAALAEWKSACAAWEKDGREGKKPTKPKKLRTFEATFNDLRIALPELPLGWVWGRLGSASLGPEYGTAAKSADEGAIPVLRMGNLQKGRLDWTDLVYSSDQAEVAAYSLTQGDVLFNRTNSPELVGKTAIYCGERPALFAGYLVRVNQIETIARGPYLTYFLNSPLAREHGKSVKTDGVNQSNINSTKLQEYPLPYCSPVEQTEIVRILDERLSAADALGEEIEVGLKRADALRQSILTEAFAGRLVPQDPDDEPAAVLLERIRAAREAKPKAKRRRRMKKSEQTEELAL